MPSLNEVSTIIRGEEGRRNVMLENSNSKDDFALSISKCKMLMKSWLSLLLLPMLQIQERSTDENQIKKTHFGADTTARITTPRETVGSFMDGLQISLEKIMVVGEAIPVTSLKSYVADIEVKQLENTARRKIFNKEEISRSRRFQTFYPNSFPKPLVHLEISLQALGS